MRRRHVQRVLRSRAETWPICESAGVAPEGWPGWPQGKTFAFVLTHDVEGERGLRSVTRLAELEMSLGFRSSFNFVPEGDYKVPASLRSWLVGHGFEVGVHDLHHDGKLYSDRKSFQRKAQRINRYLGEWDAVGFRSGFMLRNLDWIHELNIRYDSSTFDTDPFEPQPDGVNTIFPFWVPSPRLGAEDTAQRARATHPSLLPPSGPLSTPGAGYVELPYTLAQDSTLFLHLRESTADLWIRKLAWVAARGGMALVNIHPDYLDFSDDGCPGGKFSAARVRELLQCVAENFSGAYWHVCPNELAAWYAERTQPRVDGAVSFKNRPVTDGTRQLAGKRAAVLLYSYYPSDSRPRRAAQALIDSGTEVDLFCLRNDETERPREIVDGVNVFRLHLRKRRDSKLAYLNQYSRFILASFLFLARRHLKRRYDLVHVHNMPDVLVFAALIPKLRGAAVILDLHDPMPELLMGIYSLKRNSILVRTLRILERWSIAFADLALTPNVSFRDLFVSRSCSANKIEIVMNSPQSEIFDPNRFASRYTRPVSGVFRLMHHGSIVHRHGIDLLVRAVSKLQDAIPGLCLDIYGAPTSFLELVIELAKQLGIADVVCFRGPRSQAEIARAILDCNLGIVPNRRSAFTELNFPTRLFEYLAMYRPVIAPATRGIRDYFDPTQLLMFEPDNVDDLASKILWVWRQPEQTESFVARGNEVYRQNLWNREKVRFLNRVATLI